MDAEFFRQVLPGGHGFEIDEVTVDEEVVLVRAKITFPTAECPKCGQVSDRSHANYRRTVQDRACCGLAMHLELGVRKFKCINPACSRKVFCERLPGLADRNAQTTSPLTQTQQVIGLVVGGEPGSRLCKVLAIPTSADTLLRRARSFSGRGQAKPRHVGIDDWAFRKGQRYGTIIVDHDLGEIIELLDGRNAEVVGEWLAENPQVDLITRDRSSTYAKAGSEAAPQARQSADRWHLLKNLREAVERVLAAFSQEITQAAKEEANEQASQQAIGTSSSNDEVSTSSHQDQASADAKPSTERERVAQAKRMARQERHAQVRELRQQGMSIREIARREGLSRKTVRRYLDAETCPDWQPGRREHSQLDTHRPFIKDWIAQGGRQATELHRLLRDRGLEAGYDAVRRYLQPLLGRTGRPGPRPKDSEPKPEFTVPSPRRLSYCFISGSKANTDAESDNDTNEQATPTTLDRLRGRIPKLNDALNLAGELATMYRREQTGSLSDWIGRATASGPPALASFAEGLRSDQAAIELGITEDWSNGPTEGHVNRLKTIKRMMYGRGKLDLLRARVLYYSG